MKRRAAPDAGGGRDRWLISFADLMTLLFAFMLVLYVSTAFDARQQETLQGALRSSFGGKPKAPSVLDTLAERLDQELARLLVLEVLTVEREPGALRIVIHSPMLFASGSEQINNRYDDLLQHFVTQLQTLPLRVTVEGHTDALPLRGGPFQTNLALSAARAAAVGERLLTLGLPPKQLSVAGYGAERPVASNATEEGRAHNRRIVLRVIPEAYLEPPEEPSPVPEPVGS